MRREKIRKIIDKVVEVYINSSDLLKFSQEEFVRYFKLVEITCRTIKSIGGWL
ncbi:MAG: hypothetical protein ACTSW1_09425 [Candidatus Hodarchaeales archaeon]